MHICMIADKAGSVGGLQNVVYELSKVLIKNDFQVTIFCSSSRDVVSKSGNCTIQELRPRNILPPLLRFTFYDTYAYSLRVWERIKRSNYFDIIHGHGNNCFFPALIRGGIPFVFNLHGVTKAFRYRRAGPNSLLLKCPRYFPAFWPEEIATKRCNVNVACSQAVRDELVHFYGINDSRIKVIYNGVNLSVFSPMDKCIARKMLGLPEKMNYAIFVGNDPKFKGVQIAIRAVKGLKNLYLLVVGISHSNFDNVLFWGEVTDPQRLRTLYNAADFLIFPTLYEGFPLVPLEALACGLPIIISKECPTREIIRNEVEGFIVDQRKPEFYREKMMTILADHSHGQETSLCCRQLAEKYSWEKVAGKYMRLYAQLVG